MKTRDPDDLLKGINQTIMIKGLIIATAIHAVIILGTSFGLYREWGTYGFLAAPSTINHKKQIETRAAEEAKRKEAAAQRAAESEARAEAAATNKPARSATATQSLSSGNLDLDEPKEPDLGTLPPVRSFSLDDIGGL